MYGLRLKRHFDAAHHLEGYKGACSRVHGHRWDVEVCISGRKLDEMNMLIDFKVVEAVIERILGSLDHYDLNEQLRETRPTAEFIAKHLYEELPSIWGDATDGLRLVSVKVWESPEASVTYTEE